MPGPRIIVFTMGGTIAGVGKTAADTTVYAREGDRNPVLDYAPLLEGAAQVSFEAFAHVSSFEVTVPMLLTLARRIEAAFATGEADGVVITHGTNTIEESAFVLDTVLAPGRPVVVTGSMRPSTAMSADGPLNLYQAVRVAACEEAAGQGVLVAFNDRILAARYVTKAHTTAPDTFRAAEQGNLGAMVGTRPTFFAARRGFTERTLPIGDADAPAESLPQVDILYGHLGQDGWLMDEAVARAQRRERPSGLVFAGTGAGGIPNAIKPALALARDAGIPVVRASRVGSGAVSWLPVDDEFDLIPAGFLNPQKAHLLLTLALRETQDRARLRALFRLP